MKTRTDRQLAATASPVKTAKFEDLVFHDVGNSSIKGSFQQALIVFTNGYGASVVIGEWTYGGEDGLYELAVLDKDCHILYDTPITKDVEGYLTRAMVTDYLRRISRLRSK